KLKGSRPLDTICVRFQEFYLFARFCSCQLRTLETNAYESYSTLVESVENILINFGTSFGTRYTINFA
ncbi:MAG: hypothetical protein RLZZ574_1857, partial [Cyanobacteriota bacterium]